MNSMQRQIAKARGKGGENTAKVSVLLNDFEDADKMLTKIIEASKAWRDSWVSILNIQLGTVTVFEELYDPIVGASDGHGHDPVITPREQVERTTKLKGVYTDLKTDLLEEVVMMDSRIIRPAGDAKEFLQPLRKTIKKRENKRVDWERYIDKVNNLQTKKLKRTDRENAALAKAEEDLAGAADAFKVADENLREKLPPIIAAAFSIIPHLLAVQIMIQNTLLAQYYTALHNYCEETGFPSPPPPMDDVIGVWNSDFNPIKEQIERINCIARGKTVHTPLATGDDGGRKSGSITGLGVRNGIANRRASSQGKMIAPAPVSPNPQPRMGRIPSSTSISVYSPPAPSPTPSPEPLPTPAYPDYSTHLTPVSSYSAHSPAGPSGDYFQRSAAGKKKPPPPPPKRIGSQNSGIYVTAIYAFEGQSQGDLSFREGDQIKVVKKTDSTDDWWDGELRGRKGSFPANYCKMV
ncbi:Regulator of cytoskeleton and endocytosis [Lachnellula suecica]|uniref:Regulator of cytoskeleton and endocytosis n=1 Tax=Lachnellula suecica TaxID=602035 RepID=A0A8T9C7X0_9HELO|nr:Regulator of cytoskeleton and endocytosis [Lachnellula suecica]